VSYFTEEQIEQLLKITTRYIAGYSLDETHGVEFRAWAAEDDFMGVGKEFKIPLGIYGEECFIFVDDEEIYYKVADRKSISSRRFAERWKKAHEELVPIAEALGKKVRDEDLNLDPADYGQEIRLGQIWVYVTKDDPEFEVIGGETKHIILKNLNSGKNKPMQDKFIDTEYRLFKDNPEGAIVGYKLVGQDEPLDTMPVDELEDCITK